MSDFYDILGVSRKATAEEIRSAYRSLAKAFHPDAHSSEGDEAIAAYSEKMSRITEAYEVLSDEASRRRYDAIGGDAWRQSSEATFTMRTPNATECMFCAHSPVATATLRQNKGFIWMRKHAKFTIRACRGCGLALSREMQNRTLIQGWWGLISFFANFVAMIGNAFAIRKFDKLDDPQPPADKVSRPNYEPAYQGASIFKRPGVYVAAVAISIALIYVANQHSSGGQNNNWAVDSCVAGNEKYITSVVSCQNPHFGLIVSITGNSTLCPTNTTIYFTEQQVDPEPGKIVCIDSSQ